MSTAKMPVLFIGHGSPMNAIEDNEFTKNWEDTVKKIRKPKSILCISGHWETKGTFLTAMDKPKTIHDFGGFPRELFEEYYPAPGNPLLVDRVIELVPFAKKDMSWGLDHGCWSILKHMYPKADIPVVQLSLDMTKPNQLHFDLGKSLLPLREEGILIMGAGNIVHNLELAADFSKTYCFDWAKEADKLIQKLVEDRDYEKLINFSELGEAVQKAIPTREHFLPLLYAASLKTDKDSIRFFNDKGVGGSITMTSFIIS